MASEPINGAYTELFAGLSNDITEENNGGWGKIPSLQAFSYEASFSTNPMTSLTLWKD
jgi:hypothetical protein